MKSIQMKLAVTITVITLLSLSTLGGLNYWKARDAVTQILTLEMQKEAASGAGDIGDWLEGRKAEIEVMALAPIVTGGDMEAMNSFLVNVVKQNKEYDSIGFVKPDGTYLNSSGARGSLADRAYFQQAIKGESVISDPVQSKSTGKLMVPIATPVKNNGQIVGVLYGTLNIDKLTEEVLAIKMGQTGYAYVMLPNGQVIIHPDKEIANKVNALNDPKLPEALRAVNVKIVKGEPGVDSYEYNGSQKMVAYAPVPGAKWLLAVSVPKDEITGVVSALGSITLFTILAVLILSFIFIIWFARSMARPIQRLETAANRIAGGDLSQTSLGITTNDEIGRLAKSFEQMAQNVRALVKQISDEAQHLAASSEQLTASAEQSSQASNQIAGSITDVAAGAEEQLQAASQAAAVTEQMSVSIRQVAAGAEQSAAETTKATDKAQRGGEAVEKAVSQMSQIEATVNSTAKVVAKLGDRSKEIGQIVDTISGIAGQTNLLALNAAIEAARAGEQGRGFAVVAEEVRKLAEQSQEAAGKIADLIGEIQGETDKAVTAMNDGTREVKTGAEVVNAAGAAFREIADLVAAVATQAKETSAAIQQVAAGSEQIVGVVQKIDGLSKKAAGEAQSVSAAAEEQLASMEEIASSSRSLATLAQDLQTAVARFKV